MSRHPNPPEELKLYIPINNLIQQFLSTSHYLSILAQYAKCIREWDVGVNLSRVGANTMSQPAGPTSRQSGPDVFILAVLC